MKNKSTEEKVSFSELEKCEEGCGIIILDEYTSYRLNLFEEAFAPLIKAEKAKQTVNSGS